MAETEHRSRPEGVERLASKLEKPLLDNRTYRVIKLPNQLEALIIHDADTDKASAAMDVNVGSFSDDAEMPGMAHAVEHLLFMGTEKVRLSMECMGRWQQEEWQTHSMGESRTDKRSRSIQARTTTAPT